MDKYLVEQIRKTVFEKQQKVEVVKNGIILGSGVDREFTTDIDVLIKDLRGFIIETVKNGNGKVFDISIQVKEG